MTTQFLILRIQAILEGKTALDPSQIRAIASEYKRLSEDTERRLVHCASLIRAGRDHVALQVAETEPQLLESINELLFPELEEWRAYCESHSLPPPPSFNEAQIALVKSLYTREISENHPLYRDYRRAMRMHKYEEALAVIRTISKVNVTNAAAKQECERLRKRLVIDKFYQAKDAWLDGDEKKALSIAREIKDDADIMVHDVVWRTMAERIEKFEREEAEKRLAQIASELRALADSDDYQKILTLGTEFELLSSKYSISPVGNDSEFVKSQTERAGKIQEKEQEAERKTSALRAINAELSSRLKHDPAPYLKELETLKAQAADMLDGETAAKLNPIIAKLKTRILFARASRAAVLLLAASALCYGAYAAYGDYRQREIMQDAHAMVASFKNSPTLLSAQRIYAEFAKKYPELLQNPAFKNDIESFSLTIKDLEARKQRLSESFKKIEAFDTSGGNPEAWDAIFEDISKMRQDAQKFFSMERDSYIEKINGASSALTSARNKKRLETGAEVDRLLAGAAKTMELADFFSPSFSKNADKAGKLLEQARGIIEKPSSLFTPSESDMEKLETLDSRLGAMTRDMEAIEGITEELSKPDDIDAFFECLAELSAMPSVSADMRQFAQSVIDKRDAVLFSVYGGIVDPQTAAETPEDFGAAEIDFTGDEIAGRIYKHSDGQKTVYTDGKLVVRRQSWRGGSETVQEAAEIAPNGSVTNTIYRLNETEGLRPRGAILAEGGLAPESMLARRAVEVSSSISPLKAMELVGNAECSPVFKVWLEKKILDTMRADPVKSGLAFSDSLNARAKRIDDLSKELSAQSWIYAPPARANLMRSELYSAKVPDYLEEAKTRAAEVRKAYENPLKISGYVAPDGTFKTSSSVPPVFGLDASGKFRQIREGEGAKFSPIFRKE